MRTKKSTPYLYMIPDLIMVLVLVCMPVITNIVYSFFSLSSYSFSAKFVGISNHTRFFTKDTLPTMLKNNGLYCIISLIVQVDFRTLLVLLLENKATGRFRNIYRNIYYILALTSLTAIGIPFTFIYQPDLGMPNSFPGAIGYGDMARSWLGDSEIAIYCIIAMNQWQFTRYTTLLMVVAIQNVSNSYIGVASIDGTGSVKRALHVIPPLAREQLLICSIITMAGAFRLLTEVYSVIGGGPGNDTQVLGVFPYQNAFLHDNLGIAAATGVFIFMVTMALSLIQAKIARSGEV